MKFDVIKGILGEIAPTIGTALGGPVGGAAASMLADVLGCDPTPQKIEKALAQATPEQLAEIKKEHADLRIAHAISPLENPIQLRGLRRAVARIATEITKREVQ